jgi:UDP-N-acetylglucosamine diphosphorylase/glucosamine-1-phosphate N-acetyltransferase
LQAGFFGLYQLSKINEKLPSSKLFLIKILNVKNIKLPTEIKLKSIMQLCIFEDTSFVNLEPLIFSRPVFNLVCGMNTLKEKILRAYPKINYSLLCRDYIAPVLKLQNPNIDINYIKDNECLFINGSVIAPANINKIFPFKFDGNKVFKNEDKVIAAYLSGKLLEKIKENLNSPLSPELFDGIYVEHIEIKFVSYLWDLINSNGEEIKNDFNFFSTKLKGAKITGKVSQGAFLVGRKNIIINEGAEIKPGAVIDSSKGPVLIGKNAIVSYNAVIEGPAYIGENSQIKNGANIHDNVSICSMCKIGGEVEDSIFLPFANKQHDGFIGHSYIGSWVNLGAGTNCSNLKNNYGNVKTFANGKLLNSSSQFLGLFMGDHSKSAINTMFNTGTNVGFSSNVFGAGFPKKFIPSFSWGGSGSLNTYQLEKAMDVAKKVMLRRNMQMTPEEENLFIHIFNLTENERRKAGITAGQQN